MAWSCERGAASRGVWGMWGSKAFRGWLNVRPYDSSGHFDGETISHRPSQGLGLGWWEIISPIKDYFRRGSFHVCALSLANRTIISEGALIIRYGVCSIIGGLADCLSRDWWWTGLREQVIESDRAVWNSGFGNKGLRVTRSLGHDYRMHETHL